MQPPHPASGRTSAPPPMQNPSRCRAFCTPSKGKWARGKREQQAQLWLGGILNPPCALAGLQVWSLAARLCTAWNSHSSAVTVVALLLFQWWLCAKDRAVFLLLVYRERGLT